MRDQNWLLPVLAIPSMAYITGGIIGGTAGFWLGLVTGGDITGLTSTCWTVTSWAIGIAMTIAFIWNKVK